MLVWLFPAETLSEVFSIISDTQRTGYEPAHNLSSDFIE